MFSRFTLTAVGNVTVLSAASVVISNLSLVQKPLVGQLLNARVVLPLVVKYW